MPAIGQHLRSVFLSILMLGAGPLGCVQEGSAPSVEGAIALLTALLQDQHPEIRRTAAESLGKIGDRLALDDLLPLLNDSMPVVRAAAAKALGRMATPRDEAAIAGLARSIADPADSVKEAAALALGDIEPAIGQLAPLGDLLRASDVHVRRAAVRALLLLDTGRAVRWLLPLLDDSDADVRQGAVAALSLSGDARAGTAVGKRLTLDASPAVRAEAAYHLGELGGAGARRLLRAAVEHEVDAGVRRWIEAELMALRAND
jgi:HEAT repeat protein